jgi:heptosyltransferase I
VSAFHSLLIIKPGSFGDVIHALPCAAALKKFQPDLRITWLVDSRWQDLLTDSPVIDETIAFPRESFGSLPGAFRALPWARGLGTLRPDMALDLQGLLRSALMARFSRARHITGLADAREGAGLFYQTVTPVQPGEHAVRRYLRSIEALGFPRVDTPEFPLPTGTLPAALPTGRPFVLLHPYARGGGKSLTRKSIHAFCQALAPMTVVLAGRGTPGKSLPDNTVDLLNHTSIPELIGLIRAAAFVVSVDSGPMHIAAALHSRLLSIHTWSDPRLVGPFNEEASVWQGGEIRRQRFDKTALPPPRSPNDDDIAAMAQWVRERI